MFAQYHGNERGPKCKERNSAGDFGEGGRFFSFFNLLLLKEDLGKILGSNFFVSDHFVYDSSLILMLITSAEILSNSAYSFSDHEFYNSILKADLKEFSEKKPFKQTFQY